MVTIYLRRLGPFRIRSALPLFARAVTGRLPAQVRCRGGFSLVPLSSITAKNTAPTAGGLTAASAAPRSIVSRTLLAHITSPPAVAWLGPAPWPSSGRPRPLSRPAALTALGARGLQPSPAAAKSWASPHRVCCEAAGCQLVEDAEPVTDATPCIGVPSPRNRGAARPGETAARKVPCRECKHRVRFMSDRRTT